MPARSPLPTVLLGLLLVFALGACQGGSLLGRTDADAAAPGEGPAAGGMRPPVAPAGQTAWADLELVTAGAADVGVRKGPYAGDARWDALAADWGPRVERALERLLVVTGLGFEGATRPRVVLTALADERVPYELRAEVRDGHRRVLLLVNAEPLLGGVLDPDRVLLRALGAAAFEDAARRHGPVPRWLVRLAGTAAAGDAQDETVALARRAAAGERDAARVDPGDATAASATGLAALLFLSDRGEPGDVRRLLQFVADGDEADAVLGRIARQPDGRWVGPARELLLQRLGAVDLGPWRLLEEAEVVAAETGWAGLDSSLPAQPPPEVAAELLVLRASAAMREGDHAQARALLRTLGPHAPARLRDPADALALRIRAESRRGGDPEVARRLTRELERDFPRSVARQVLLREHPLLGMEEDPQRWWRALRRRIETDGSADLGLETISRYARTLLQDHRAGAAQRFLESLGPRGEAPELIPVREAVADAQGQPSAAALDRSAQRVAAWYASGDDERARDVGDGGRAAIPALIGLLEAPAAPERARVVRLLVEAAGITDAAQALEPSWAAAARGIPADLGTLASLAPYADVRAAVSDARLRRHGVGDVEATWEEVRLGMAPDWLAAHPGFLAAARHPDYTVRRSAFDRLLRGESQSASPRFVAHGLSDDAALLRREAVRLAGAAGFVALARRALQDRAGIVRAQACRVVGALDGPRAVALLVERLRTDDDVAVREAAAIALIRAAPTDPIALRVLVGTLVERSPAVRETVAPALARLEPLPVARAIALAWRRAVRRPRPDPGFLFRTALLFQRLSGVDLDYTPQGNRAALGAVLRRMEAWIAREAARPRRQAVVDAGPGRESAPAGPRAR